VLVLVSVAVLAAAGCTTLTEISKPGGPNTTGFSLDVAPKQSLSGDGRFSLFYGRRSTSDATPEVYRRDNKYDVTARVSSDASGAPVGSADAVMSRTGRFVAFETTAALVPGDTNLGPTSQETGYDIYVRDMATPGSYDLVSLDPDGHQIPSNPNGAVVNPYISADGRYVAFEVYGPCSSACTTSVFVRDRVAHTTTAAGGGTLVGLSGDGLHVGIDETSDCYAGCPPVDFGGLVVDWKAGTHVEIGCESFGPMVISDDGRFVATWQTGVQSGCTAGVALYDRTRLAPPRMAAPSALTATGGLVGNADASRIAFDTTAALDPSDTNGVRDVYVVDFIGLRQVASRTLGDGPANGPSFAAGMSADGSMVQFATDASNLVPNDRDGKRDTVLTPSFRPVVAANPAVSIARGQMHTVRMVVSPLGVRVTGNDFSPGTYVVSGGPGVTGSNVRAPFEAALDVDITVAPDAEPGSRDLLVSYVLPYGIAAGVCHGCVRVT